MTSPVTRRGVTLVELIVVLAILGVAAGITGLAMHRAVPVPAARAWARALSDARRLALRSGRAATVIVMIDSIPHAMTALPDGSTIADSSLDIDQLTGAPMPIAREP